MKQPERDAILEVGKWMDEGGYSIGTPEAYEEFVKKRNYPIMKTYDTFEQVEDMQPCVKRPIIVHAKRIDTEFRVNTLEGNYKQGKAGDYLMRGIDGELYICDGPIFEKTYDFVPKLGSGVNFRPTPPDEE